jgi:hypothetical protein
LDQFSDDLDDGFSNFPESLKDLRANLLGDYRIPDEPPPLFNKAGLSNAMIASLKHYVAWKKSNGTMQAFNLHREVLISVTGLEILSLYKVQKLAMQIADFCPTKVDMCPKSCIAYTGPYRDLDKCPFFIKSQGANTICNEPRYRNGDTNKRKPRAQVQILPVMSTIHAMFHNADTAKQLRHRDSCLKQALHLVGRAKTYSDFGDSKIHEMQRTKMSLFEDARDISFALSTDGAQLTMKKHSNTWLLILIILNLPPTIRYKTKNVIINFATPGPNSPGDIESFIQPLFEEMAMASEGIWIWDAIDSSYFMGHACIVMALGDMLGSAKLNGMAGHSAIFGDRFALVQGAKASNSKGAKAQYYPIFPPESEKFNPTRPTYDLKNLPMRTQSEYWKTIMNIEKATTKRQKANISKSTGVLRLPLCAGSAAFIHPSFFPVDPFHLFYENCASFLWDTWMSPSNVEEIFHLDEDKGKQFGVLVSDAMKTLPPAFCGPVRDPFLKRNSQYKIYEWMALVHWYIVPIGIELGFNSIMLSNFAKFASVVEFAMTIKPRSEKELQDLETSIIQFLTQYEGIYVDGKPENIVRSRLCIFQLIHIPRHIRWNGSIRIGSQATVERSIGEMGRKIRSKKAPFQNLANQIFEKELIKILTLYYADLDVGENTNEMNTFGFKLIQLQKKSQKSQTMNAEIGAINNWLEKNIVEDNIAFQRWGKLKLRNGRVLQSELGISKAQSSRRYLWFEVRI